MKCFKGDFLALAKHDPANQFWSWQLIFESQAAYTHTHSFFFSSPRKKSRQTTVCLTDSSCVLRSSREIMRKETLHQDSHGRFRGTYHVFPHFPSHPLNSRPDTTVILGFGAECLR